MAGDTKTLIAIFGPPGLSRDLIEHVLNSHDDIVVSGPEDDPGPDVAILVDPEPAHWEIALISAMGVIVVTSEARDDPAVVDACLQGADAVLTHDVGADDLRHAVAVVASGGTLLEPAQARMIADMARGRVGMTASDAIHLTGREQEILASVAQGQLVKQTARSLGISVKTVENLQRRLFRKLDVRNRAHAIARAHELGLLPDAAHDGPGPDAEGHR